MDNQKNPGTSHDEEWFDDLLGDKKTPTQVPPEPETVTTESAYLVSPEDAELERIIQETKAMDEPVIYTPQEPAAGPFRDEEYRDAFGAGEELEAVFNEINPPQEEPTPTLEPEPTEEVQDEPKATPAKKGFPRFKKGYGLFGIPHVLATVLWIAIVVVIGSSLGRMVWVCVADVMAFGKEENERVVTFTVADDLDSKAQKLKDAGIIQYTDLFKLYITLTNSEEDLSLGSHKLKTNYDYHALTNAMAPKAAARQEIEVMIPEGYTCAQIFRLLEDANVCTVAELEEYAANGDLNDYWFLSDVKRGTRYCLEGYLFPDTYRFYTNDDPELVLEKFLDNFDYRFTDAMIEKLDPLNERLAATLSRRGYSQTYIKEHEMTFHDIVIVASMIEKETANDSESYEIASVIYNRLTNPGNYPYLNIDATIVYALGGKTDPLTAADLQINSPYNSYTNPGLIPAPISNPGRNSLNAALDPDETSYYYYALNPETGVHKFSSTKAEHDRFVNSLG